MKINRYLFKNKDYVIEDDIDFSNVQLDPTHIRKINNTHVKISGIDYEDYLILDIEIKTEVIGVCSYTLDDVPLKLNFKSTLSFTYDKEDEENIIIDGPIFDIDEYVLSLIISEVPLKLVKKGAKLPSSGMGYRVMSEDEYNKEAETKKDNRWNKLDELDLE